MPTLSLALTLSLSASLSLLSLGLSASEPPRGLRPPSRQSAGGRLPDGSSLPAVDHHQRPCLTGRAAVRADHKIKAGQGHARRTMLLDAALVLEVNERVAVLFKDHPDLLGGWKEFLPEAAVAMAG